MFDTKKPYNLAVRPRFQPYDVLTLRKPYESGYSRTSGNAERYILLIYGHCDNSTFNSTLELAGALHGERQQVTWLRVRRIGINSWKCYFQNFANPTHTTTTTIITTTATTIIITQKILKHTDPVHVPTIQQGTLFWFSLCTHGLNSWFLEKKEFKQ